MAAFMPAAVFGLKVPTGGMPIPATIDFPASFRITMAAIDPSAPPDMDAHPEGAAPRATLKLIREALSADDEDDDDEDYDDVDAIRARLAGIISDEDEDEDEDEDMSDDDEDESEEEKNGGPSDPAKSKQARKEAAARELRKLLKEEEDMELDEMPNGVNGTSKGKGKALDDEDDDEDISSDEEDLGAEVEEFVVCTLDPEKNFQQTLDITVGEHEMVYFSSTGTHEIYLTGNYVIPPDNHYGSETSEDEDDELDYDLSPDEDELDLDDEEDDELDGLDDPRVTEVDTDEEEAPKLVKAADKKGKNKRPAVDSEDDDKAETLDDLISKTIKEAPITNGEQKLSKKQQKKLKKNDGEAAAAPQHASAAKKEEAPGSDKKDKKVQFAKNLELGPTGSPKVDNKKEAPKTNTAKAEAPKGDAAKAASGQKIVNGVTIDDKRAGKGPAAKKGDKIGMRYIGKLKDGKVFDSNKKGKPFTFKLGAGEVIKGWDIGVAGITVGGERRITIPASLGYGNKAMPGIPAKSELIFDIKCLSIN